MKIPEELNITTLWKKDIINSTAPLWKCFINDLSAYEMVKFKKKKKKKKKKKINQNNIILFYK